MIFQEVLELNQLRQQAIDREQKLFIEVRISLLLFNPLQYETSSFILKHVTYGTDAHLLQLRYFILLQTYVNTNPSRKLLQKKSTFSLSQASDWEAKFYQIQSKYLLLLNELHNPQVFSHNSLKRKWKHINL